MNGMKMSLAMFCLLLLATLTSSHQMPSVGMALQEQLSLCSPQRCLVQCPGRDNLDLYRSVMEGAAQAQVDRIALKESGGEICHGLTRPWLLKEPRVWQRVRDRPMLPFSAFYEDRAAAGGPAIRVVGAGLQKDYNDIGQFHCVLWYQDRQHAISPHKADYVRIYPSTLHGDMWVSHFLLCPLPCHIPTLPYAISVVSKRCIQGTNTLMVLHPGTVPRKDHALCMQPLYNNFKLWKMIVEMVELHRILGADKITVYRQGWNPDVEKTLQTYMNKDKFIEYIAWHFPNIKSNVFCQRGSINDCFYRNRFLYKYITVTDLDEILVPRLPNTRTWPELLAKIHTPGRGAFLFQHAYFRRNDTSLANPPLITQSSFWRTHEVTPPGKIRCKSMYDADAGVSIDLHFPYQLVPGAQEYILPPEEGMLHHYRSSPMTTFAQHPERFTYIEDRFMSWLQPYLSKRYLAVVTDVEKQGR